MPYSSSTGPSSHSKTFTFEAANARELENLRPTNGEEMHGDQDNSTKFSLDLLLESSLQDDAQFSDVIQSAPQRLIDNHATTNKNCRFRSIRISEPGRKVYIDLISGEPTSPGEVIFETVAGYSDHHSPILETKIKGLKGPCQLHRDTYFQLSAGTGEIIQLKAESAQFRCRYFAPQNIARQVLSLTPKPYEIAMNTCQGGFPGNVRLHVYPLLDFSAQIAIDLRSTKQSAASEKGAKANSNPIRIAIDGSYDDRPIEWSEEVRSIALALQQFSDVRNEIRDIIASVATKSKDTIACDGPLLGFQLNNLRYEVIEGFPATDIAYDIRAGIEPLFSTQFSSNIGESLAALVSGTPAQKLIGGGRISARGVDRDITLFVKGTLGGEISASKTIGRTLDTSNGSCQSNLYFEIKAPMLDKLNYHIIAVQGPSSASRSACFSSRIAILNKGYHGAQLSMSTVFGGLKISRITNGNFSKKRVFGGKKAVRSSAGMISDNAVVDHSPEVSSDLEEIVLAEGRTLFERTIPLIQ